MGMRVIAIDGGDEKRELCLKLGAEVYIDFKTTKDIPAEVLKITKYGAHGVIVTAATRAAYETAPNYLRPNGTVVAVGLPQDPTIIAGAPPMAVALRRLKIVGSVTGSMKDVEEALDFTARGLVRVSTLIYGRVLYTGANYHSQFCQRVSWRILTSGLISWRRVRLPVVVFFKFLLELVSRVVERLFSDGWTELCASRFLGIRFKFCERIISSQAHNPFLLILLAK
jgi:hypothetical protein